MSGALVAGSRNDESQLLNELDRACLMIGSDRYCLHS
jgi:hypothetical protein